uniref:Uncharacterized protein n=1 Tax=Arundo donax TaxID=35708 RepID=A0A0A9C8P4_ARUDO
MLSHTFSHFLTQPMKGKRGPSNTS